ncbi:MAG: helix-turn-helix domain-containing protein [Wujia sp.]
MKITSAEDFGRALKQQRKQMGYTQSYLADVTGLSTSFISDLENGKATAELGKALFLANLLGMDIEIRERN